MRDLINFIFKNIHWLFFFLLVFISSFLIINNNEFQRSKYLAFKTEIIGKGHLVSSYVNSYLGLRETNQKLILQITEQESLIQKLQQQLAELSVTMKTPTFIDDSARFEKYEFIAARVINNNVSGVENLIMLDKGSNQGVENDMGVFSLEGIVGRVIHTSPNFSVVISLLNPKFRPSCKVVGDNSFGPLIWKERDPRYAYLEELPRHVVFHIGDTVVTSGYSTVFPEGVPVGVITSSEKQTNDNFNSVKVKLFTNFITLKEVFIVKMNNKEEVQELENTFETNVE